MSDPQLIGRILEHAPDWKWVRLKPGHGEIEHGDALRVRYHAEADWRPGIVRVSFQDGDRIYVEGAAWFDGIPAVADMDYVYRWTP